jgi:hypothetical protein
MEQAVKYTESINAFQNVLDQICEVCEVKVGRRFDRIVVDGEVRYFVDRNSWEIFGAKSSFQYNPRRQYGKLDTIAQFDWAKNRPILGTAVEVDWNAREASIQKQYKPRGRPRKITAPTQP